MKCLGLYVPFNSFGHIGTGNCNSNHNEYLPGKMLNKSLIYSIFIIYNDNIPQRPHIFCIRQCTDER